MASMLFPLQIQRQQASSLDDSAIWDTKTGLDNYVATSPVAYAGQILYCKEEDKMYRIKADKSLEPLGGGGSGDEPTYTDLNGANIGELGGWKSGDIANEMTLQDAFYKLLHKYIPPSVTFSTVPNDSIYEKGITVPTITLIANITKNSDSITKIEFKKNSAVIKTITTGVADGGPFTFIYSTPFTTNTSFSVEVTDASGEPPVTKSKAITFINTSYTGIIDVDTPTPLIVAGLSKVLNPSKGYEWKNIALTNKRCCYAYPSSYGTLTKITDTNGFDVTDAFKRTDMTINGVAYFVYSNIIICSLTNGSFKFQ